MARGDKKVTMVAFKEDGGGEGLLQARKPPRNARRSQRETLCGWEPAEIDSRVPWGNGTLQVGVVTSKRDDGALVGMAMRRFGPWCCSDSDVVGCIE